MYNGHMGPRKFWRTELPQLKYHNPAVSMTVDRDATNEENPLLTIFFTDPDAKQTSGQKTGGPAATTSTSGDKVASDHAPAERTKSVDMAGKMPYDIVQDIIRLTGATKINPTGEEIQLLRQLKSERERSEADRMKMQAVNDEKKRQAQLLAEARGMTA